MFSRKTTRSIAFLEVERVARVGLARPQADVKVEHLAHPDDGRAVDEALARSSGDEFGLGRLDRLGGDGAEHRRVDAPRADRSCAAGRHRPPCARTPSRYRRGCTRRRGRACRGRSVRLRAPRRRCRHPAARQSCISPYRSFLVAGRVGAPGVRAPRGTRQGLTRGVQAVAARRGRSARGRAHHAPTSLPSWHFRIHGTAGE